MKRMSVLFLVNGFSPYRLDFFHNLGKVCNLSVLCERKVAKDRSWNIDESKIKGFKFVVMKGIPCTPDTRFCPGVIHYLAHRKYDFIIVANYNTPTGILAMEYMKRYKIPFAIECDGGIPKSGIGLKESVKKKLISSATWWFSPSAVSDEYLEFYGAKKNRIMRYPFTSIKKEEILINPLTSQDKYKIREQLKLKEEKIVIAVGQFIPRKGFDILLKASQFVNKKYGIYIIGGEPTLDYLLLKKEYALDHVHFVGFTSKETLKQYYKAADLFVLPTREDIWGLVINEAMSYGLPVITTNRCVAGITLLDSECIVPVEDTITFAEKMNMILGNDELRYNIANKNLQVIQNYTLENMSNIHVKWIKKILKYNIMKQKSKEKKKIKHILYVCNSCSKHKYEELFTNSTVMISQQAQKYHNLLIEGIASNQRKVTCISGMPINRQLTKQWYIPKQTEINQSIRYSYLGFINMPLLRQMCLLINSYRNTLIFLKKDKETILICDVLHTSITLGAILAARWSGTSTIGIVTDVPGYLAMGQGAGTNAIVKINWNLLSLFQGYIFLTEEMNHLINIANKPFLVLEGHVDIQMEQKENRLEDKYEIKTILYAGCLTRIYGVELLTKAFIHAALPNCQLHLYGTGDYVEDLIRIEKEQTNVVYCGIKPNDYIVEQEQKATILVNPRPTNELYTKYSFPSKNMEYMASGTPTLTTKLAGMPKEYEPYVYLIEDETVEGISKTLTDLLSLPKEELHLKGLRAKEFVLREKNNKVQAEKIINLVDEIG